jgi:hypothetical protein
VTDKSTGKEVSRRPLRSKGEGQQIVDHWGDHAAPKPAEPGHGGSKHLGTTLPPPGASAQGAWIKRDVHPIAAGAVEKIYPGQPSRWKGDTYVAKLNNALAVMGWDGTMGFDPLMGKQVTNAFHPDLSHPADPMGVHVLWHEVHHSIGSTPQTMRAEASDYMTREGHDYEEGFTELGAWLTMPDFLDHAGIADRPTGYHSYPTLGEFFRGQMKPDFYTGDSSTGDVAKAVLVYQKQVKAAYLWLDGIAKLERTRNGPNREATPEVRFARVVELSKEVNAQSGPAKLDAMASQVLRALELDGSARVKMPGKPAMPLSIAVTEAVRDNWGPNAAAGVLTRLRYLKRNGYLPAGVKIP